MNPRKRSPEGTRPVTNPASDECRLSLVESWDREYAIIETMSFSSRIGFGRIEQTLIATAVSELATNILRYAGRGEIVLRIVEKTEHPGIEIRATDAGPGIDDVDRAMRDGFSTTKDSLGLGLSAVRRIMDEFEIDSAPGKGTRVLARKWRNDATR